ncbi:hypothetical protein D3C84_678870 [compost metagenome]
MDLKGLEYLLTGGAPLAGCELSQADAVSLVAAQFPGRAFCLVADWVLIDMITSERVANALAKKGGLPSIVLSLCVLKDSRERFPFGHWVKSSQGVTFTLGCLFETRNTVYALMGAGRRIRADFDTVMSLINTS